MTYQDFINRAGRARSSLEMVSLVKEFELDAYKAGMTAAAEVYTISMRKHHPDGLTMQELNITQAILTARDNLKELPL